jgi:hypothetical protein
MQLEEKMGVPSSTAICAAALMLLVGSASADPWKDESGKGRWRGRLWMGRTGA